MNVRPRERLVSLTPLPAGWRGIYVYWDPDGDDLEQLRDEELFFEQPVAAIAHVQVWERTAFDSAPDGDWDDSVDDVLRPVIPMESHFDHSDAGDDLLMLVAPGEPTPNVRQWAIDRAKTNRKLRARKAASNV